MGVVYRATQLALDRTVAVKVIAPRLAQDDAFRERFGRESHLAASIEHPNVIPVYEAGELEGTLYLIMRWVDGTDLRAMLAADGRLSPARAVKLLRPVASALAAAHRRGLIHRDVKPANVLIARGDDEQEEHVYLTDFGIARRADTDSVTRTGVLVGTLDYTAPERIEGAKGSPASDIYAFGCMLFETLTGHIPFERPTELAKMHAHINDPAPSPAAEAPGVPNQLAAIVTRAMAKRPEDRYSSAGELAVELAECEVGPDAAAEEAPTELAATRVSEEPARTGGGRTRPRTGVVAGAVVALVAAAGVAIALLAGGGAGHKRPSSPPLASGPSHRSTTPRAGTGEPLVLAGNGLTIGNVIKLPGTPAGLAADGNRAWVIAGTQLARVGTGGAADPVARLPGTANDLAVDGTGRVWMTGIGSTGVMVFVPNTRKLTPVLAGQEVSPNLIAISPGAAWLSRSGSSTVTRVGLNLQSRKTIPVGGPISALGAAFGRVWVAGAGGGVTVLDGDGTRSDLAGPSVPSGTVEISSSNGVWFLSAGRHLTRVDPRASAAAGRTYAMHPDQAPVGPLPAGIGALHQDNSIWVLTKGDSMLTRIATGGADNNRVIARVKFPGVPGDVAVGDHVVWVDIPGTGQVYPVMF